MKASGIGGQAVLEGIMMRNKGQYSVAVRKPDKEIAIDVRDCKDISKRNKIFKLPFIRGVFNFVDSLVIGLKSLTYSAEFYDEEEDVESLEEKSVDKVTKSVFKEKAEEVLMAITVLISVLFSVGLFILLPYGISELLKKFVDIKSNTLLAVIESFIRIFIFILYMFLISRMNDIKRTFMYHGAEHKCINCIEHGYELNVENVRKSSRIHKRCGTSFLFFVMFISIVCFILVSLVLPENATVLLKFIVRILLVPVIAGISYEILRAAGTHDNGFLNFISKPGMLMQKFTTKEPDDSMIEVGIKAVEAVFDWKEFINDIDVGCENATSNKDISDATTDETSKDPILMAMEKEIAEALDDDL